jgi:uncharacterized protein YjcR
MTAKFAKASEIAEKFRVSVDAVYLWIREGKIPAECVVRIAGTIRVDEEEFERQLRAGALYRPRGRKAAHVANVGGGGLSGEDNFTTSRSGPRIDHRWTGESGEVESSHPFSPEMVLSTR